MSQDKGTKNSLTKLFDALFNTDNPSLEFLKTGYPKVGQYGAHEAFKEVEYEVDESKIRLPYRSKLVQTIDPTCYRFSL